MEAAAAAPSSRRVPPMIHRLTVTAVISTATTPKIGPICMIRCAPIAVRQVAERRGEDQLGQEVGGGQDADRGAGDVRAAVLGQRVEVVDQQAAGQAGAEAQREGAEQDRRDRSVHETGSGLAVAPALLPPEQQAQEQRVQQQDGAAGDQDPHAPGVVRSIPGCGRARGRLASLLQVTRLERVARLGQLRRPDRCPSSPIVATSPGSPSSWADAAARAARASASASASSAAAGRPPSPSNAARRVSGGVSSRSAAASSIRSRSSQDVVRIVERLARIVELPRSHLGPDRLWQLPVLGRRHGGGVGMPCRLARRQLPLLIVVDDPVLPQVGCTTRRCAPPAGRAAAASRPGRTRRRAPPARRRGSAGRPSRPPSAACQTVRRPARSVRSAMRRASE